ncbi:MAG: trypsin-like serine protease [Betaproteobacteria bacterium]|nr:trypsin-like serine protease [Betaproteobacteria bacterium]
MNPALARAAALLAAVAAIPAAAILTRADRDDGEYRELATRYPATVSLGAAGGAGVLIGPRWVLTAAQPAAALRDRKPAATVVIAGQAHGVQAVFIHPDWKPGGDADIALVLLREAAVDAATSPIYRSGDEAGEAVRLVGFGETGAIGAKAPGPADGKARAAINTVDRVGPRTLGLRIKPKEEASDLQGAAAPGDAGAPGYLEVGGRIFVGGIVSAAEDANGDGIRGNVGDWDRLTRVSAFAAWIDEVTGRLAAEEAAAAVGDTERR